jgi:hypothetical protein
VLAERADRLVGGADAVLVIDDTGVPKTHLVRSFDVELPNLLDVVWRHADETGQAYLPVSSPRFILKGGRPDDAVRLRFQTRLSGALKLTHCPIESRSMRWRRPKLLSRGSPSANGFAQSPWICSDTLSGLRDRPWTLRRPSPQRC